MTATYYVIHDQDDLYVSDFDNDGLCVWSPSSEVPHKFDTLMDAVACIEAHGLDTDVVEVQFVTEPTHGDLVRVTSQATWLGTPLHDRIGVVEEPIASVLRLHLIDGFRRGDDPEWVYLWEHEVAPAHLRPCSEVARAERREVAA
jgi:hypothetical protein